MLWMLRIVVDLLAKSSDRMIDRPRRWRIDVAPGLAQQLVAVNDSLLSLSEVSQHLELSMGEIEVCAFARRRQRPEVDEDAAWCEAVEDRPRAPEYRPNPRQPLVDVERLRLLPPASAVITNVSALR